ncbi:MAG: GerMN domain-containing protein [Lachnospiraceae bacterium]|nr:GerMN domain-containing protein [Lachnospiraceae bacterium]
MKKIGKIVVPMLFVVWLAGCISHGSLGKGQYEYQIMFLKKSQMELTGISYYTDATQTASVIDELWEQFKTTPQDLDAVSIVNEEVSLVNWKLESGILHLYFPEKYLQMDGATELLLRAGIVRTFSQVEGIEGIQFYVNEQPLCDQSGNQIPIMKASDFVDITGAEVNMVQIRNLSLYYANEKGDGLLADTIKVAYSNPSSVEEFIIQQLIDGPGDDRYYPILNPQTKLNRIEVRDKVCYVDFDEAFLEDPWFVQPEVVIFSIVNSLCELHEVTQVQISVNGFSNLTYRDVIPLSEAFERNLDYVETENKLQIVNQE